MGFDDVGRPEGVIWGWPIDELSGHQTKPPPPALKPRSDERVSQLHAGGPASRGPGADGGPGDHWVLMLQLDECLARLTISLGRMRAELTLCPRVDSERLSLRIDRILEQLDALKSQDG